MKITFLKTTNPHFRRIKNKTKNVEIRNNDRNFKKLEVYGLLEYSELKGYSGELIIIKIIWVENYFEGLKEKYCMFGFKILYEGYLHDFRSIK